jgi:uncharacterized protein
VQVNVADIQDEGLDLDCGETPQELDLAYPDTNFQGKIRSKVRLARFNDTITLSGVTEATVVMECGRCGQPYSNPLSLPMETVFSPQERTETPGGKDEQLEMEELGRYTYSGHTINLGEFVREQILLALPMVPLCRPDCRGLCVRCGKNLNLESCNCFSEETHGAPKT